jgi:hypothetical protein
MKTIQVGQEVFLMTPGGAPIDARVHEVADGTLTLALLSETREPVAGLAGADVALQFANRRGICRVTGTAEPSSLGEKAIEFVAAGSVEVVQRREYVRVDAVVPASYKPYGASGRTVRAKTVNVSGGGFLLAQSEGLQPGSKSAFTLELGDRAGRVSVVGKAVRTDRGGLGIQIVGIDRDDRDRLVRWIFARERLAIRVARRG